MRILFINDTDRVEIAAAFRASMQKRRTEKIELIATDVCAKSPMKFVCDHFEVIPEKKDKRLEERLLDLIQSFHVHGVLAGSNFDLPILSRIAKRLAGQNIDVLCPSDKVIKLTLDKSLYPNFCGSASLTTPRIFNVEAGERPRFPCVIKPSQGQGSKSTYIVGSLAELRKNLPHVKKAIVQEFIKGDLYTVDIFGDEAGLPVCIVPRVRERELYSRSGVSRVELNEQVMEAAARLAQTLRIKGLYNCQVVRDIGGCPYILDINPRLAPGAVLSMKAGAPFARWTCDLLTNGHLVDRRYRIREGLEMFKYETQFWTTSSP